MAFFLDLVGDPIVVLPRRLVTEDFRGLALRVRHGGLARPRLKRMRTVAVLIQRAAHVHERPPLKKREPLRKFLQTLRLRALLDLAHDERRRGDAHGCCWLARGLY